MKRKTEQDYHNLAKNRGFKWLGLKLPKDTHTLTLWECSNGHNFKSRYGEISRGRGCSICVIETKRKTEKDYYWLADSRGFRWIGLVLPKRTKIRTLWRCSNGHEWETTYASIKNGGGCPYCYGNVKKTEKDYHELANNCGFEWVGEKLSPNVMTKTLWKCKNNHIFAANYVNIHAGWGCKFCSGVIKKTEKDYHELAKSRGFKWVGERLPRNNKIKTLWQCKKEHIWRARYNDICNGNGCPYCQDFINGQRVSKPQRKLNDLLYGSINYPEGRYRVDVAIMRSSKKIAVEYDAQYWHNGREEQDIKRDKYLISKDWKIIHVKSGILLPTRKQMKQAINKLLKNKNVIDLYLDDWVRDDKE